MSFLALPFLFPILFPILVIAALVLCPIATVKLVYGCVTGFRKDIVSHMSLGERIRSFLCVFAMASELNVKRRLRQIGNAVKVVASWLCVVTAVVTLAVPSYLLGIVYGIVKVFIGGILESAKEVSEEVADDIRSGFETAITPASRSVSRR